MVGPFVQYEPPGVYTRTLTDNTLISLTGGLRIPVLIGVGTETLSLVDYELVRGSSSTVDNVKTDEDVSSQFLSGVNREIQVSLFPIVNGEGQGIPTFNPKDVKVVVNGQPAGVAQVDGPRGKILLSSIPASGDKVTVTYYFKNGDTRVGGSTAYPNPEDLSNQVDGSNKQFKVFYAPIVDGTNGGIASTDPSKIEVTIKRGSDQFMAVVSAVNGQAGTFTLTEAPQAGDQVLVSYWTSKWQDTFDYLPVDNITEVIRVGTGPGRNDFTNTLDFIIEGNKIHWGSAFNISSGFTSSVIGSVPFKDQVVASLYDHKLYARPVSGDVDGLNKTFTLEYIPTEGTGKGDITDNPNLISIYVGINLQEALDNYPVGVAKLTGATREVVLKDSPPEGYKVFATYWHNMLTDDTFTLMCRQPSTPSASGRYEVFSANNANANVLNMIEDKPSHAVADPNFGIEGITFPEEGFDGTLIPGYAKEETILINFINNTDYLVLSSIGEAGTNGSGSLGQTYKDSKTGTMITIMRGTTVTYQPGDILEFDITKNFYTSNIPHFSIPGIKMKISELAGVTSSNTCNFKTYNKSGSEPKNGEFYFVSAKYSKTEFPIKIYTKIKDVTSDMGEVNTNNRISLAASLAFSNGAIAIALAQVLRDSQGVDASSQAYLDVLKTLESPIAGTNVKPDIICAITTKQDVINEIRLHCEKMSTIRNKTERTAVFGYPVGTTPEQAQQFARNQKSERLIGLYPDGAIIGLLDEFGNVTEAAVDGSFLAAAFTGLAVNPIYDVATPLTHKTLTGFRRLIRTLDSVTMNQTAISGITILEDLVPNVLIRQAMTTDPSNILTREPTVIYIKDFVQQQIRSTLSPFIGIKFLPNVNQDVEAAVNNLLNNLVNLQIITAFQGTSAVADPIDPSILRVETFYSPVLPLNWIVVNLNLRVRL